MTEYQYRLDQNCRLIDPIVGDAEIRSIQFESLNMRLQIVQPFDGTQIELLLGGFVFLFFHTDHPQNVIERIFVYSSWESARFPSEIKPDDDLEKKFTLWGKYIVVIESIAGGPLVCGARDLSMRVETTG